jgi:Kef-type K+ transport system membrane component KefB
MSYWSTMVVELRRRRRSLARAITPLRASFLEFLVFAAVGLSLTGPFFLSQRWDIRAPALVFAVFVALYLVLEAQRQKRAASAPKRSDDLIALALYLALPFAALAAAWASHQPPEIAGPLAIPEAPPKAVTATIVP